MSEEVPPPIPASAWDGEWATYAKTDAQRQEEITLEALLETMRKLRIRAGAVHIAPEPREISKEEALRFLNGMDGIRYAKYCPETGELTLV